MANNWAVVCVTDQHPKGAADYSRFVRKHERYFALSRAGDIISGVAHVDPALSPWQPPAQKTFDSLNAAMVPSVLGAHKKSAAIFASSWNARVSPGEMLYSSSPEGTGILAVSRGDDPFAVTTQIRTLWR